MFKNIAIFVLVIMLIFVFSYAAEVIYKLISVGGLLG